MAMYSWVQNSCPQSLFASVEPVFAMGRDLSADGHADDGIDDSAFPPVEKLLRWRRRPNRNDAQLRTVTTTCSCVSSPESLLSRPFYSMPAAIDRSRFLLPSSVDVYSGHPRSLQRTKQEGGWHQRQMEKPSDEQAEEPYTVCTPPTVCTMC